MHSDIRSRTIVVQPLSFKAANGWRGPGSLAIALAHLAVATDLFDIRHLEPIALMVDLFFVLSGFVIAQAYSTKLGRPSAIPEYIVRRFGRIWPLQAAMLAMLIAYELFKVFLEKVVGHHFSIEPFGGGGLNLWQAIPTNLLLIQSLGLHDRETWNFPSWSLSVEFVTYLSFAAFCLLGPTARRVLAVATIAVSLAILMYVAPRHMRSTFDYGLFRCLAGFFAGTLCHDVVMRWRIPRWPFPTLVEIVTLAAIGFWLANAFGTHAVYAAPLVFSIFLYVFVAGRGLVSRALATAPMQVFAEWSFAIYMVHALVLIVMLALLHEGQRTTGLTLFATIANPAAIWRGNPPTIEVLHLTSIPLIVLMFLLYTATVMVGAYLAYRIVETPGRAVFGRLAKRFDTRPTRAVASAGAAQLERAQ